MPSLTQQLVPIISLESTVCSRTYYPGKLRHFWQLFDSACRTDSEPFCVGVLDEVSGADSEIERFVRFCGRIAGHWLRPRLVLVATASVAGVRGRSEAWRSALNSISGGADQGEGNGSVPILIPVPGEEDGSVEFRPWPAERSRSPEPGVHASCGDISLESTLAALVSGWRSEEELPTNGIVIHSEASSVNAEEVIEEMEVSFDDGNPCILADVQCYCRYSSSDRDLDELWRITVATSDDTILPTWQDYDHIEHFILYGWRDFDARQQLASERLFGLIGQLNLSEIHDVGCGSGEIVDSLAKLWDARRATENGGASSPARFVAYDRSLRQLARTRQRVGRRVEVRDEVRTLAEIKIGSTQGCLVMMLGNTLAHIGAEEFWRWLTTNSNEFPEYMLIDFAVEWKEVLDQADPEVVCGPLAEFDTPGGPLYAHLTTAAGPGWVKRGIVLQFGVRPEGAEAGDLGSDAPPPNSLSSREHRMFTRQFADPPDTYFNTLAARGYSLSHSTRYTSGWGVHDLYLYEFTGHAQEFPWPRLPDKTESALAEAWYRILAKKWRGLADPMRQDSLPCFPVGVVPFGRKGVFARYIPRVEEERDGALSGLFKVWMWVVDPRDGSLKHEGAPKNESVLPYAPSLFKVLLARSPSQTIEHFDRLQKELRVDSNAADFELAFLERKWLDSEGEDSLDVYYAVPVYLSGLPCFVVIVRAGEVDVHGTDIAGHLNVLRVKLRKQLGGIGVAEWGEFVGELLREGVPKATVRELLTKVEEREWTSWLEGAPARGVLRLEGEAKAGFSELRRTHQEVLRSLNLTGSGNKEKGEDVKKTIQFINSPVSHAAIGTDGEVVIGDAATKVSQEEGEMLLEELRKVRGMTGGESAEGDEELLDTMIEEGENGRWEAVLAQARQLGRGVRDSAERIGAKVLIGLLKGE